MRRDGIGVYSVRGSISLVTFSLYRGPGAGHGWILVRRRIFVQKRQEHPRGSGRLRSDGPPVNISSRIVTYGHSHRGAHDPAENKRIVAVHTNRCPSRVHENTGKIAMSDDVVYVVPWGHPDRTRRIEPNSPAKYPCTRPGRPRRSPPRRGRGLGAWGLGGLGAVGTIIRTSARRSPRSVYPGRLPGTSRRKVPARSTTRAGDCSHLLWPFMADRSAFPHP